MEAGPPARPAPINGTDQRMMTGLDQSSADLAKVRVLAAYRHCVERIHTAWPDYSRRRAERLQQGLFDAPVEKVAENILEDLFTTVLDWTIPDVNLQVGRADVVLSELGIKRLVLEVKRPGSLAWHRRGIEAALDQARRYASVQKVGAVAVSDGRRIYAADLVNGGLRDRLYVSLDAHDPPEELWWISVHGIYRACPGTYVQFDAPGAQGPPGASGHSDDGGLLHPKYHLPVTCFAYVGSAEDPHTWKLPYLALDGTPDTKRLPKAIQSILSNYRGAKVSIPRTAVADVLVRLGETAAEIGKMPCQRESTADAYIEAHEALDQLDRLREVRCCCLAATGR